MDQTERPLEEYKLCQNTTARLEDTVWKTSGAIGFGSLGAFVLVTFQREQPEWQTILIMGFLVSITSLIWWFMAKRWWDIQHATFLRMKHLEKELHFYQVNYIYHKDGTFDLQPDGLGLTQSHIDELNGDRDRKCHLRGVQSWLRLLPYWVIPISWVEYTLYRWNEKTGFYDTECQEQLFICVAVNVGLLLLLVFGNFFWIKHEGEIPDRIKRVQARYSNKEKNGSN